MFVTFVTKFVASSLQSCCFVPLWTILCEYCVSWNKRNKSTSCRYHTVFMGLIKMYPIPSLIFTSIPYPETRDCTSAKVKVWGAHLQPALSGKIPWYKVNNHSSTSESINLGTLSRSRVSSLIHTYQSCFKLINHCIKDTYGKLILGLRSFRKARHFWRSPRHML